MTRIAHISDLHLLEPEHQRRRTADRFRLELLSFGRPLDAEDRRARLRRALETIRRAGADHLVVTGDLTEDGRDPQFEVLVEVLLDAGVRPEAATVVPGNHDAYTDGDAFARALEGPLRPFARTSRPGTVTPVGEALVVSVSTAMPQPITRSAGAITDQALASLDALAADRATRHAALVVAQHHPPHPHRMPGANWVDGLQNHAHARDVLRRHRHVHVLCGHTHRASDRVVGTDPLPRVFCTTAVVDHASPVRFYEVRQGRLVPVRVPSLGGSARPAPRQGLLPAGAGFAAASGHSAPASV